MPPSCPNTGVKEDVQARVAAVGHENAVLLACCLCCAHTPAGCSGMRASGSARRGRRGRAPHAANLELGIDGIEHLGANAIVGHEDTVLLAMLSLLCA